jgi:ABC-type multidrug transport system permease subunit
MKYNIIFPIFAALFTIFTAWAGGFEFQRGYNAGVLCAVTLVVSIVTYLIGTICDYEGDHAP